LRLNPWLHQSLGAALIALAASCSPHVAAGGSAALATASEVHPVSGLAVIPLSIFASGTVHQFRVEIARTDTEQEKGLMFRTKMGADEGMIFPMSPPRSAAFWMRNTVIPLDIIFVGADHRILNVAANAVPYDERPLPSSGAVSGVLELTGGRAGQLGIGPGDRVTW
jgi:uncharacterized membrane protein (UPF0127 family)